MLIILALRFFCIILSSICVPIVLGSVAIDTPVPSTPVEEVPTQPVNNRKINNKNNFYFIIFKI